MLELGLLILAALIIAVGGVLRVVAPRTLTKKDDRVLDVVEKVEPYAKDYVDAKTKR